MSLGRWLVPQPDRLNVFEVHANEVLSEAILRLPQEILLHKEILITRFLELEKSIFLDLELQLELSEVLLRFTAILGVWRKSIDLARTLKVRTIAHEQATL